MNTSVKATRELFNTILPPLSYASTMNKGGVFSSAFYRLGKMGKVAVEQAQAGNLLLQFEPDGVTYSEVARDNAVQETYVVAEYNNTTDQEQTYSLQKTEQFESQLTFCFAEDCNLDCSCTIAVDLPAFFPAEEKLQTRLDCGPSLVNNVTHPQTVYLDQTVIVPAHGSATYEMVIERCSFQTQFSISWRPRLTPTGQELWGAESFEAAVLAMASIERLPKEVDLHLYSKGSLSGKMQWVSGHGIAR